MSRSMLLLGLTLSAAIAIGVTVAARAVPDYPITPVPLAQVKVTGGFWQAKLDTNRTVTIPHILDENESTGRVDNFRKGAGLMPGDYQGRRFNDTDIYKIVEAASYTLVYHPDPALQAKLTALIDLIARNQQPDGYLEPARTINPDKPAAGIGAERWSYENTGSHETYNAGHLIEAAVANYQATGSRALLDVAVKDANLLVSTFGAGKREDAPGHEVVEMALIRLARATGDPRYLDLAKFFLDERGTDHHASLDYTDASWKLYNDRPYRQDDVPVTEQTRAEGHAVRAMYLYNAMADIAGLLKTPAYNTAIDRLWQDVVSKRIYLTGGLGSIGGTEAFGDDYALPNRTAYTETCASVGGILWNHRMFLKSGDAKYLDAFEQTLYNGLLSGVSVKGDTFFYQNPLESAGRNERSAYFDVACCPANLSRLIAQLPGLIYAQRGNDVFVNLYVNSDADIKIAGGTLHLTQTTNYPWDGKVSISATADKPMNVTLHLRQPGWLGAGPFASDLYTFSAAKDTAVTYVVAGRSQTAPSARPWLDAPLSVGPTQKTPTAVQLSLPMPVRIVTANAGVKDDAGKFALQRGPVVYALEGVDNGGKVLDLTVPVSTTWTPQSRADLLGGVTTLTATMPAIDAAPARTITAIPYFAWANRGRGEMVVWIKH